MLQPFLILCFINKIQMNANPQLPQSPHLLPYFHQSSTFSDSPYSQQHPNHLKEQTNLIFPSDLFSQQCISPTISLTNGFSRIPCENTEEKPRDEIDFEREDELLIGEGQIIQENQESKLNNRQKNQVRRLQAEDLLEENAKKLEQIKQRVHDHLLNLRFHLNQLELRKQSGIAILQHHTQQIFNQIMPSLTQKIELKLSNCSYLISQLSLQNQLYHSLLTQLMQCSHSKLMGQFGESLYHNIRNTIENLQSKTIDKCDIKLIDPIHPEPLLYEFLVDNFDEKRRNKEELLSEYFEGCSGKWVLKIYPAGFIGPNSPAKMKEIQYLSIYVQMIDNISSNAKFVVKVQLIDEKNPAHVVSKEFQAEYVKGESWGYDRYIRVANLYRQGLVDYNNRLKIRILITFSHYREGMKTLNHLISQKQKREYENDRKIRKLKSLLQKKSGQEEIKIKNSEQKTEINFRQMRVRKQRREGVEIPQKSMRLGTISLEKQNIPKIIRLCSIKNSFLQKNKIYIRRFNASTS